MKNPRRSFFILISIKEKNAKEAKTNLSSIFQLLGTPNSTFIDQKDKSITFGGRLVCQTIYTGSFTDRVVL